MLDGPDDVLGMGEIFVLQHRTERRTDIQSADPLHGSIQLSETASREQLGQELARLRQKNEADRLAFQTKLKFSRSPMVGKLASSYETIEAFIDRERAEQDGPFSEVWRRGLSAEEALLLAEYSLDFAAQAANHALLLSLEAVSAQDIPRGKETEVEQNEVSL